MCLTQVRGLAHLFVRDVAVGRGEATLWTLDRSPGGTHRRLKLKGDLYFLSRTESFPVGCSFLTLYGHFP